MNKNQKQASRSIIASSLFILLSSCGVDGVNSTSSRLTTANLDGLVGTWKQNPYPVQESGNDHFYRISFQQLSTGPYMTVTTVCQTPGGTAPTPLTQLPVPNTYTMPTSTYNLALPQTVTGANGSVAYQAQVSSQATISADTLSATTSTYFNAGTYYAPCTAQIKPGNFSYSLNGNTLTIKNYSSNSASPDVTFTRQ